MPILSSNHRSRLPAAFLLAMGFLMLVMTVKGRANAANDELNLLQLQQLAREGQTNDRPLKLRGTIGYANAGTKLIVLQDASAAALLECEPFPENAKPGQQVRLTGKFIADKYVATLSLGGEQLCVGPACGMNGKTVTLNLTAGYYPFTVTCFNPNNLTDLGIYYAPSGAVRQRLPASALFHAEADAATHRTNWLPGINYRVFETTGETLPDLTLLKPAKSGLTANFDLNLRTRLRNFAMEFTGFIKIPRDGSNSFYLDPINAGDLLVQPDHFEIEDGSAAPPPRTLTLGQILPATDSSIWAQIEGTVTFCGRGQSGRPLLQIHSGTGNIEAEVWGGLELPASLLNDARVRLTGVCQGADTLDNKLVPGRLSVPGNDGIEVLEISPEVWKSMAATPVASAAITNHAGGGLVHVSGKITALHAKGLARLEDATGATWIRFGQTTPPPLETNLDVLAVASRNGDAPLLQCGVWRLSATAAGETNGLPVLTAVAQIKRLSREDAVRGYPVNITGVVTWSEQNAVVIQDASGSVFVDTMPTEYSHQKRVGELWKVTGQTTARFSPMVLCHGAERLGLGIMPEPIHASGDQLKNGTLDTEYVEIEGAVISIQQKTIVLLTHNGRIKVNLPDADESYLSRYQGAVIRIRGCLWAVKDEVTHFFEVSEVQIHNASISLDHPAPEDPFSVQAKRVRQLLLYDANARAFQPVKIAGQIVHVGNGQYFLMDGTNGLRFSLRTNQPVSLGDLVEVVGYPDLGGISPVLHDALLRTTGHAPLPKPRALDTQTIVPPEFDSTLVRLSGKLANLSLESDAILTLQTGSRFFRAHCDRKFAGQLAIPIGSHLELTGVMAGQGGSILNGRNVDGFELLLNSPADIQVITFPPWWTLKRVLMLVLVLTGILALSLLWIAVLHRQVDERTEQLRIEIQARQASEFKNAIESERSRIARDLHDELGSSVTEISMVADAGAGATLAPERSKERFNVIAQKSRDMVRALDTIVWLVNPRKDLLPHFAAYLGSFAQEFLGEAGIACRQAFQPDIPTIPLNTELRHNLFLATKEALTNVVRHAKATRVELGLLVTDQTLQISVEDDGQGFDLSRPNDRNGLVNLQSRLESIGGHCAIDSGPGLGTKICLSLPLPGAGKSANMCL